MFDSNIWQYSWRFKTYEPTTEDWVLALLYANNRKPLHGKLMLVKEILKSEGNGSDLDNELQFFPVWSFGPYSKILAERVMLWLTRV